MAIKTRVVESRHFPARLRLVVKKDEAAPQLTKDEERQLLKLAYPAWRLMRARLRQKAAKTVSEAVRDRVLTLMPRSVYGVQVLGRRSLQVLAVASRIEQPHRPEELVDYLGAHASEVITGIKLPVSTILQDPKNYRRLIEVITSTFGDDVGQLVQVAYDKGKLTEMIEDGTLPEPPETLFETVPSESRRVLVQRIDNPK